MDQPIFEIELDTHQNIFVKNIKNIENLSNTQGLENVTELTYLITEAGINTIRKFARENEIIHKITVWETVCHDGGDEWGPKSYLWDLYIEYQNKIYKFHREDWYYDVEKRDYVLCE